MFDTIRNALLRQVVLRDLYNLQKQGGFLARFNGFSFNSNRRIQKTRKRFNAVEWKIRRVELQNFITFFFHT